MKILHFGVYIKCFELSFHPVLKLVDVVICRHLGCGVELIVEDLCRFLYVMNEKIGSYFVSCVFRPSFHIISPIEYRFS